MASALSKEKCAEINLGYLNRQIALNIEDYRNDPDCLVVDDAGEVLYLV